MTGPNVIFTLVLLTVFATISLRIVEAHICYNCFYSADKSTADKFENLVAFGKNDPDCENKPVNKRDYPDFDKCATINGTMKSGTTFFIRTAVEDKGFKTKCRTAINLMGERMDHNTINRDAGFALFNEIKLTTFCYCETELCSKDDISRYKSPGNNIGTTFILTTLPLISRIIGACLY